MNNIEDKSDLFCSGCGACTVACPVNAIEYKLNDKGFFQAFVNEEKCVHCGKCKKVCARFLNNEESRKRLIDSKLYSAQSKDENIVRTCTSGGIAYEISKYGLEHGYKIVGTIFDNEKLQAKMIIARDMKELELLKGSKYLQSYTIDAIEEMIKDCKKDANNKYIIFGTPCQIQGISKLIKNEKIKNEIIKIDLFCHGVPSYAVWNIYCKEIKEKYKLKKIKNIEFRNKKDGWHSYCMKLVDLNDNNQYISESKNYFYKIFFDDMMLNKSCYNCNVRKEYSYADIRLGDFWGRKYYNKQDGVSAILVFSEKGKNLLQQTNINIIEEFDNVEECLNYQSTQDYKNIELNNKYINKVKDYTLLSKLIKDYRSDFNLNKRIKLYIKDNMGRISPKLKYNFKKFYYRVKRKD